MPKFSTDKNNFIYDGKPLRLRSGAMHYFRVVPEYWEDRLLKMKACGLNTVETYVAWNLHEPKQGQYCFDGILDIERFIRIAGKVGLHVIFRPGPYICSEWDFGGLPAWLLADPEMKIRCCYKPYLDALDGFFDALIPRIVPLQCTKGGPVIAVQVENEYGSYGSDKKYLEHVRDGLKKRGVDVLLFTSDGATDHMLQGGTIKDTLITVNFADSPALHFGKMSEYQPEGPNMCMELYPGWFTHWLADFKTRKTEDVLKTLKELLDRGDSFNYYMFHGGTNFGFMSGANNHGKDGYKPAMTSYDFDAPLNEAGDPTDKYIAIREMIAAHEKLELPPVPPPSLKKAYGKVAFEKHVSLFDSIGALTKSVSSPMPETMEKLGQNYGFILYRAHVTGPKTDAKIVIKGLRDRALIFLDGKFIGVQDRTLPDETQKISIPKTGAQLDILVENMGRTNYGPNLIDRKGILDGVKINMQYVHGWENYTLPLDNLDKLNFKKTSTQSSGPVFLKGEFNVDSPHDTFVKLPGLEKGVCWINGFNLGRYWSKGPQHTLYLPAPLLKKGTNELIVFELHNTDGAKFAELIDHPELLRSGSGQ